MSSPRRTIAPARVFSLRMALNETQAQFAKRFDVTPACVSFWEQGARRLDGPAAIVFDMIESQHKAELREWSKKSRKMLAVV